MNRVEKQRLKEICNKVLEINKTAEDYVGIFVDGVPSDILNFQGKTLYFIFKDGDGQKELYNLTYNDCILCYNNGLLEENSYKGFKRRQIFKFKINEVKNIWRIKAMNNIEILEKFIDKVDIYFNDDIGDCAITSKIAGIIKNLIKENKELKEEIKSLNRIIKYANDMLAEEIENRDREE